MSGLCEDVAPLLEAELAVLVLVGVLEGVLQVDHLPPLLGLFLLEREETAAHFSGNLDGWSSE